jgi:hypothetical protein
MMGGHSLIPAHALAGRPLDGARRGEFHIKPLDAWATAESPLLEPPPPSACSTSGGCVDRSPVAIPRPPRREARVRGRGTGPMSSSGGTATRALEALIPLSSPVTQLPDGRVLLEQADGLTLLLEPEAAYPRS